MSTIRQYAAGNSFYESMYGTSNNTQSNSFLSGLNMNAGAGGTYTSSGSYSSALSSLVSTKIDTKE